MSFKHVKNSVISARHRSKRQRFDNNVPGPQLSYIVNTTQQGILRTISYLSLVKYLDIVSQFGKGIREDRPCFRRTQSVSVSACLPRVLSKMADRPSRPGANVKSLTMILVILMNFPRPNFVINSQLHGINVSHDFEQTILKSPIRHRSDSPQSNVSVRPGSPSPPDVSDVHTILVPGRIHPRTLVVIPIC